ncbi:glycosyltransferase [Nocardioides sp. CCNWLW239]|uniref:glycosyltransferase n=1 Tax=Nocardioides sp. CCNWLW239 TaxID=3128902 RepID=UPI003015C760
MTGTNRPADEPLRVVVSVGTDSHPFDRLVRATEGWADTWSRLHQRPVDLWVQHGHSKPPTTGTAVSTVGREELFERFAAADVLVTQVGPGTILDANALGRRPIVVPRRHHLGEHVDDHQVTFGRFMHDQGGALLAMENHDLHALMTRMAEDRALGTIPGRARSTAETAVRLEREVTDAIAAERPRGTTLRRLAAIVGNSRRLSRRRPLPPAQPPTNERKK